MKLTMIQTLGTAMKEYRQTGERLLRLIDKAGKTDTDLILLPECAYPAYFIGLDKEGDAVKAAQEFLEQVAKAARYYQVYIVLGIAMTESGQLYNSAVVFDRQGDLVGRTHKSNLWHFDYKWFAAGTESFVFNTEFGKLGVMICADGRIPEIARMLRIQGAQLILDLVNLVASAEIPEELSNQQYRFILQTRARENGVPIAVCDKAGVESDAVTFLGRSFITSATGEMVAQCGPRNEELLTYELELPKLRPLLRKPQLYSMLSTPTAELPVTEIINTSYRLEELELFTAVVRYSSRGRAAYISKAWEYIRTCVLMDAKLIVLPPASAELTEEQALELCGGIPDGVVVALAMGEEGSRRALLLNSGGLADTLWKTHGAVDRPIRVAEILPGRRVAALFEEEMEIPEIARVAMLEGTDLLLWFDHEPRKSTMKLLQTRAAENKIFTLRSTSIGEEDCSLIVNPEGAVICTTFRQGDHVAAGMIHTALSKSKVVVPGTNIVTSRIPEFYKELSR